ncbi:MAG: hypothetical protein JST12_08080 [Armatimonadetes bacterium]|nr:hypothetical protein [Armatimonadota bacterium]MBS1701604.1 hypothetical protein [Armatimonadota bacterium]MBS1725651.1 hypothetical protein [Armatimonadota bacterium]
MDRKLLICLVAGLTVAGCGSGTSTPIAPDQQMPDTSKMSADEVQKLHSEGSATEKGAPPANNPMTTDHGYTPADRQTGR